MTVISDATVSTGNQEQPLTREEALATASELLRHPIHYYDSRQVRHMVEAELIGALIAYAAELRQGAPAAAQEPAGDAEPFRVGICVCGAEWWSDSKPYVDAKSGQAHHLGHRT